MNRVGQQRRIPLEKRLLLGVFGEQLHRAGQRVASRVVPREHDQQPCALEVFVGQFLAVDLGIGDRAHQVIARLGAAVHHHVAAIGEHLADGRVEPLDECQHLGGQRAAVSQLIRALGGELAAISRKWIQWTNFGRLLRARRAFRTG